MNSKDFELIARVIKAHAWRNHQGDGPINQLAHDMAEALRATNKQFNSDKFIRACGGQP